MELCTLLIGLAFLCAFIVIQKFWKLNSYLKSLGVPIDWKTPWFKQNFLFYKHDIECLQKFGVKKFDKFMNRRDFGVEEKVKSIGSYL